MPNRDFIREERDGPHGERRVIRTYDLAAPNSGDVSVRGTFEHLGFYEDVYDLDEQRMLGTRPAQEQVGRPLGYAGNRRETVTVPLLLQRGHKQVVVKASPEKPLHIETTLQRLCGRMVKIETIPTPPT